MVGFDALTAERIRKLIWHQEVEDGHSLTLCVEQTLPRGEWGMADSAGSPRGEAPEFGGWGKRDLADGGWVESERRDGEEQQLADSMRVRDIWWGPRPSLVPTREPRSGVLSTKERLEQDPETTRTRRLDFGRLTLRDCVERKPGRQSTRENLDRNPRHEATRERRGNKNYSENVKLSGDGGNWGLPLKVNTLVLISRPPST